MSPAESAALRKVWGDALQALQNLVDAIRHDGANKEHALRAAEQILEDQTL